MVFETLVNAYLGELLKSLGNFTSPKKNEGFPDYRKEYLPPVVTWNAPETPTPFYVKCWIFPQKRRIH
jgi:hypothetical protein